MSKLKQIQEKNDKYLMNTYGRLPVNFVDGHEATLVDQDGNEYIDFVAGIAVCNLGYSNEKVKEAIINSANTITHTSNLFLNENQARAAELLCEYSFADKVFFSNSGAEANEGAVKIARRQAQSVYGKDKNEIIYASHSFHGRTLLTMNITDNEDYKKGYGPHPTGFIRVPFNDIDAVKDAISDKTAGVIVEPIQGEGGVYPADQSYLEELRELTKKYNAALIFDEVQTGMGRTGKLFAYEHYGVEPDIMTLAKGLGNGIPIGAILAKGVYADTLQPGSHGTTFGGNQLATAVAIAVTEEMLEKDIPHYAGEIGQYFIDQLNELKKSVDIIEDVRGKGLLIGVELSVPGGEVVPAMLERGYIINCTQGNVLRFIPPLVITKDEIDQMLIHLKDILLTISV